MKHFTDVLIESIIQNILMEDTEINTEDSLIVYHGTPFKSSADSISAHGLDAAKATVKNGGSGDMPSVQGLNYLAKDIWNAVRYASMNMKEPYGYVFEFKIDKKDLLPDEDTLGALVWKNLNNATYKSIVNKLSKELLDELTQDKEGAFELFARAGRYLIPKLTTDEALFIIENTDTVTTRKTLKPTQRYKFKKIKLGFKDKTKYVDDEEQKQINLVKD